MTQDEAKRLVAQRAVDFITNGMAVGLGTGTTANMFIEELATRAKRDALRLRCVASSNASHTLAASLGLDVTTFDELPELDIYIDGADEIGPGLALVKGGGGALLREKIVASAAKQFIVVADSTKLVDHLGKFPLPVEVIKMATPLVERRLTALGLNPHLRRRPDGTPYLTDEQNYILDCVGNHITNPVQTAADIRAIVGVVEHGLFLDMASLALIADESGVTEHRRQMHS
jgi:ribose 5-phosphate isomerase A